MDSVIIGNMNGRVENNKIEEAVCMYGVDGVNEKKLVPGGHMSRKMAILTNLFFQHKLIHKYTWRRKDEKAQQMSMNNNMTVD